MYLYSAGNAQGEYQSTSGKAGFTIFSWKVGRILTCGQLCVLVAMCQRSSPFLRFIALQPAVYAKYTTGGAFEIMASHDKVYNYTNRKVNNTINSIELVCYTAT